MTKREILIMKIILGITLFNTTLVALSQLYFFIRVIIWRVT